MKEYQEKDWNHIGMSKERLKLWRNDRKTETFRVRQEEDRGNQEFSGGIYGLLDNFRRNILILYKK